MVRHTLIASLLLLGGCVDTVRFSAVAPGRAAAEQALAAERALTHPPAVSMARSEGGRDQMTFCTAAGKVEIAMARITDEGVCGLDITPYADESRRAAGEQCWRYADMSAIGRPRDATAFGYYPVRGYLSCPEAQS